MTSSRHELHAQTGARILLFLLFLVIECLPVTVKLLQQPGNYEQILDQDGRARSSGGLGPDGDPRCLEAGR